MKIASFNLGKTEKPESERFAPFMTFLKFVIPGFKEAYDQKMALQNYDAKMKAQYRIRVPLLETPKSIFDLPYTTKNNKPKKQLISKKLFGGKNEYKFRRGSLNLNNGYGVIYDLIMLTVQNGLPTYDYPPIVAGRTIYQTPSGNDTIFYRNNPDIFNHTPKGDPNQQRAKNYFYKMIKSAPSEGLEYKGTKYWNNLYQSTYDARRRALRGYQEGGPVERTDNTRVASGRPLVTLNKIPWGAGKGPAGESPMRLFNDPYVNMGLMAMGPMVGRYKPGETPPLHINGVKLAPPTLQDIMNYLRLSPKTSEAPRVMGLGVRNLSKMSGKSPEEVIRTMSLKFGEPQTYPKALDNSEPAYGWTFENPDNYRLALQLFNLK